MKKIAFNKIGILSVTILSFVMCSCGGSSGGGEEEISFEVKDLVNKYWYANQYVSADYKQEDALIVYWFEKNGDLVRQEFSGRKESNVGSWSLDEKKIIITDETFGNGESIDWFIQSGTDVANLVLSADNGRKMNCTTSISVMADVTADAFVVSSINVSDEVFKYMQCRVTGKNILEAKLLLSPDRSFDLIKVVEGTESVFVLDDNSLEELKSDDFPANDDAKFYLKLDNNMEVKLDDINDDRVIATLENKINYNQGTHVVKWNALDDKNVYYRVEILNREAKILFRSHALSADAKEVMEIKIDKNFDSEFDYFDELQVGTPYELRITGVKYEADMDPDTWKHEDYNVQTKTIFAYDMVW